MVCRSVGQSVGWLPQEEAARKRSRTSSQRKTAKEKAEQEEAVRKRSRTVVQRKGGERKDRTGRSSKKNYVFFLAKHRFPARKRSRTPDQQKRWQKKRQSRKKQPGKKQNV